MEDAVGDRVLKSLPKRSMSFIDGSISSYCYILNSPKGLEQISKTKKLASVLCDLEYDCMREEEEKNKRAVEAEENISRKFEEKQVR